MLRTFDHTIATCLTESMEKGPVKLHKRTQVTKVEKDSNGTLTVTTNGKEEEREGEGRLFHYRGSHRRSREIDLGHRKKSPYGET